MKIDLNKIDKEQFRVLEKEIAREICYLVNPLSIGVKWNPENLIFRSSIWDNQGNLISACYKKFFNFTEQPDLCPFPSKANNINCLEKLDGSALIFSMFKNINIVRTRGAFDVSALNNSFELDFLKNKYPALFSFFDGVEPSEFSIITEWTTRTNRIVLDYGEEPKLFLTGIINHSDYSYWSQDKLDNYAQKLNIERPKRYSFDSVEEMQKTVFGWKNLEGICIYYDSDQNIRKLKSEDYLIKHSFKENCTLEKCIDLFFAFNCPDYQKFEEEFTKVYDFECWSMARGFVSQICDGYKEVNKILDSMKNFVILYQGKTRKELALAAKAAYGNTNRMNFVFSVADNKVDNEIKKKLLYQVLKNK